MFEIALGICLLSQPDLCRDVLLPGYESPSIELCESHLDNAEDKYKTKFPKYKQKDRPKCVEAGTVADFVEVAPGVFAHKGVVADVEKENYGDISNVGFVVGKHSIAVIDSSSSRKVAEEVYRAIRQHSDLPIRYLILTHMHPDHVFGASVFVDAGAEVIGHKNLDRALQDRAESYHDNLSRLMGAQSFIGSEIVGTDRVVDGEMEIDLGERVLQLQTWPLSHTGTDLTVMDMQTQTLFAGDLVFHEHTPALDGSVLGWQKVLQQMEKLSVKILVPGHGGPALAWPDGAKPIEAYLDVLEKDTREAIDKGISLSHAVDDIGKSQADKWELFELFNTRNATTAYTELEWE